jgi:hypothetical protein
MTPPMNQPMTQPMKQSVRLVQIGEIVRLRASGSQAAPTGGEVVVVCDRNGPVIVHWGASLGGEPMLGAVRAGAELPAYPASVTWPLRNAGDSIWRTRL